MEAEELLDLLRMCAWAPPSDGDDPGLHYRTAAKTHLHGRITSLSVRKVHKCSIWDGKMCPLYRGVLISDFPD